MNEQPMASKPRFRSTLIIGLVLLAGIGLITALFFWQWMSKQHLAPRGGLYFFKRVELAVPQFFQADPAWADDRLGPTEGTLGKEGCAVASASMVLASYGVDVDPGRLNAFLKTHAGFTPEGWLYWEKAAEFAPEKAQHIYEDLPSYALIDLQLLNGNPVIIRIRFANNVTHFVVIIGKDGFDYLIRDPGQGGEKGIYPLHEFGSDIEALRYYRKL